MRFPNAPSNWKTKAKDTWGDLERIRKAFEEILQWIRENPGGGGDVDLSNYLKRSADDWAAFPTSTPQLTDRVLIESAADGFAKRVAPFSAFDPYGVGSRPLYLPPLVSNPFDIEGNSNPGWLYRDFTNGAARTITTGSPSILTGIGSSTANPVASFGSQRRSWIRIQIPNPGPTYQAGYYTPTLQTPTLPTWYWARLGNPGNVGANPNVCMLAIWDDIAGVPDINNFDAVGNYFPGSGDAPTPVLLSVSGGVRTNVGFGNANQLFQPSEYFACRRTASGFSAFTFNETGAVYRFGTGARTSTSFWVGVYMANNTTNVSSILNIDFVRQSQSDEPWMQP